MSLEHQLIKVLLEDFDTYERIIDPTTLTPEARIIYDAIPAVRNSAATVGDIRTYLFTLPTSPSAELLQYLERVESAKSPNGVISRWLTRECAARLADLSDNHLDQHKDDYLSRARDIIEKAEEKTQALLRTNDVEESVTSFTPLLDRLTVSRSTRWRIGFLNDAVGPLYPGLFVLVGGRPESAKTTFLVSEIAHLLDTESDEKAEAIIFNNESHGDVLRFRFMQSVLGKTRQEIVSNIDAHNEEYQKWMGDKTVRVVDCHGWHYQEIETYIKKHCDLDHLKVIAFDQASKLHGYEKAGNAAERLLRLAGTLRRWATEYAPVITTIWADGTAENQQYIGQDQLYDSKTGFPGEADVILNIGYDRQYPDKRFLNIPKNKSIACRLEHLRHSQCVIRINSSTARLRSVQIGG